MKNRERIGWCFLLTTVHGTVAAQTTVGGQVATNTTWTAAGSPYLVTSKLSVIGTATLTIQPGVEVRFSPGLGMEIGGSTGSAALIARGTATAPIRFTGTTASAGSWAGITFSPGSQDATVDAANQYVSGSILEHCSLSFAGASQTPAVTFAPGTPFLGKCIIQDVAGDGVRLAAPRSLAVVRNCTLSRIVGNAASYWSDSADGGIRILENRIEQAGQSGVDVRLRWHSSATGMWVVDNAIDACANGVTISYGGTYEGHSDISRNRISGCGNAGVQYNGSGFSGQVFRFSRNYVARCRIGMQLAISSFLQVSVVACDIVSNTDQGLSVNVYAFGDVTVTDNSIGANGRGATGAGVLLSGYSAPYGLNPSRFYRNHMFDNRGGLGGGLAMTGCFDVDGCTFVGNSGSDGGAAFFGNINQNTRLANCVFLGNTAQRGDDIFLSGPTATSLTAQRCSFAGPHTISHPNQVWDSHDDPTLGTLNFSGCYAGDPFASVGLGTDGLWGIPRLRASGSFLQKTTTTFDLADVAPISVGLLGLGDATSYQWALGGVILPDVTRGFATIGFVSDPKGTARIDLPILSALPAWTRIQAQAFVLDAAAPGGVALSTGVVGVAR